MARQVYTPCLLNILGKRSTLQLSKSRNIRAWGNSAFAERWHSNIQALPSITWSCLSRSMGVALCFRHCCLSRLQVFIDAFSVDGPVRQAPGTAFALHFVDARAYCVLPVCSQCAWQQVMSFMPCRTHLKALSSQLVSAAYSCRLHLRFCRISRCETPHTHALCSCACIWYIMTVAFCQEPSIAIH